VRVRGRAMRESGGGVYREGGREGRERNMERVGGRGNGVERCRYGGRER